MDLLKQQKELQKEGNRLLKRTGLIEFLSQFGTVRINGSLASGLMVWPDIDLEVVSETISEDNFWKAVRFLFSIEKHNTFIQDFRESTNPNTPKGLYIGKKINEGKNIWKIDIWFITPRQDGELNYNDWIKDKLTEENKKIILEIKNQIYDDPKYRKEIFSIDIYKAVIENGVKNLEEFKIYLQNQGRSLSKR